MDIKSVNDKIKEAILADPVAKKVLEDAGVDIDEALKATEDLPQFDIETIGADLTRIAAEIEKDFGEESLITQFAKSQLDLWNQLKSLVQTTPEQS